MKFLKCLRMLQCVQGYEYGVLLVHQLILMRPAIHDKPTNGEGDDVHFIRPARLLS